MISALFSKIALGPRVPRIALGPRVPRIALRPRVPRIALEPWNPGTKIHAELPSINLVFFNIFCGGKDR